MFKLKHFILPFILLLSFTDLKAAEFDAIAEGKQFHRKTAGSPIYLEKSSAALDSPSPATCNTSESP